MYIRSVAFLFASAGRVPPHHSYFSAVTLRFVVVGLGCLIVEVVGMGGSDRQ